MSSYTTTTADIGAHVVTVTVSDGLLEDSQDVTVTVNSEIDTTLPLVQISLSWDLNSEDDLAGYKVYYGGVSGQYENSEDIGNMTAYTVFLYEDKETYFTLTAYDGVGNESGYSNEAVYRDSTQQSTPSGGDSDDIGDIAGDGEEGGGGGGDGGDIDIAVNHAPVLDTIEDSMIVEGDTITLNPTAIDIDGDDLTFTYSGWMTGASYTTTIDDIGVHIVSVTVSDGLLIDVQDVEITVDGIGIAVNHAPRLVSIEKY